MSAIRAGYKQTEVGVIPSDWTLQELSSVAVISRLAGAEYTSMWKESHDGEIIALRGFNIGAGKIIENDCARISNELSLKLKRSRLCSGDVIYPCVGSIGNAAVVTEDSKYHIQQNIARITPNPSLISSSYLANYLMSFLGNREVARFNASSSQPSVLVGSLRQYRVPIPPSKLEQNAIAEALSDADALIESLEQLLAKKRHLKQGTMQELLTGKKRLPGFSGEWEVKRLGEVAKIQRGASPRPIDSPIWFDENSSVGWVRISDVTRSGMYLTETLQRLSPLGVEHSRPVANGSLIMSICATVGRPIITSIDVCIHDGFVVFDSPQADKKFLYYILSWIEPDWSKHGQTGSQMNLNTPLINGTAVNFPPLHEQLAIAAVLSDMDAEIAELESELAKTRTLKQGMMQKLLTGEIRLI